MFCVQFIHCLSLQMSWSSFKPTVMRYSLTFSIVTLMLWWRLSRVHWMHYAGESLPAHQGVAPAGSTPQLAPQTAATLMIVHSGHALVLWLIWFSLCPTLSFSQASRRFRTQWTRPWGWSRRSASIYHSGRTPIHRPIRALLEQGLTRARVNQITTYKHKYFFTNFSLSLHPPPLSVSSPISSSASY